MRGLMMDVPLTIRAILERGGVLFPEKEIVTRTARGLHRYTYGELHARACRLANALRALGVRPGDRVGTFAWNSHRHLELYLAVPSSGAVLHTVNIRLFPEQITYIVNHAADAVLFVDDSLVAQLEPHADALRTVRAFVVMGDGPLPATTLAPIHRYEDLLARRRGRRSTGRRSTRTTPPACATPPARQATRRASSTATAPSSCSASRRPWPTRSA